MCHVVMQTKWQGDVPEVSGARHCDGRPVAELASLREDDLMRRVPHLPKETGS